MPEGVTDPMLWRLAVRVAEQHRGGEHGECRNLQCLDRAQPCAPWAWSQQALRLAQPPRQQPAWQPQQQPTWQQPAEQSAPVGHPHHRHGSPAAAA
ncbi:hypothetical protein AWW66_19390 [Micromonospora rosaria]|uniref:Uncharacterized protein n=1 Tax=Micromonospora rosaria TaxID=47874 RepID=A0A136PP91_9ACTN|nr:hypothetical protein AWW66_19390 [Micromonospora rosaria]